MSYFSSIDNDSASIYRQDERDRDQYGNSLGLRLVSAGNIGFFHATKNYDEASSPAGQSKLNNEISSDEWSWDTGPDLRSEDVLVITRQSGAVVTRVVGGAPADRGVLNRSKCFLTPLAGQIVIVAGTWNA